MMSGHMPLHSSEETIRSLRVTLTKLEENFPASGDKPAIREFRRIILKRIADLEITQANLIVGESNISEESTTPVPAVANEMEVEIE